LKPGKGRKLLKKQKQGVTDMADDSPKRLGIYSDPPEIKGVFGAGTHGIKKWPPALKPEPPYRSLTEEALALSAQYDMGFDAEDATYIGSRAMESFVLALRNKEHEKAKRTIQRAQVEWQILTFEQGVGD
jgi:hypothetical protein